MTKPTGSVFFVKGGTPLKGSIRVGGAKNASYKLMIAALLADSQSTLLNFSHISDVALVADCINSFGATASTYGERAYLIDPQGFSEWKLSSEYGAAARASTMFLPAMLAKFGKAAVPLPGGDKIGARPLDRHMLGLEKLGVHIEQKDGYLYAETKGLVGTNYRFEKNTHTGTETLIMAAVKAKGKTILENAAEETEVDDLIDFLNSMGAKIKRTKTRVIEIDGVEKLHGSIHKIMPDQNQAVSFACAAIASKGDVIVENTRVQDLQAFLDALDQAGANYEVGNYGIRFFYTKPLKATNITTAIHPGFKTDWQPLWVTLMTQAEGESILHETISQNRFGYTKALSEMGANISLFNPEVTNPEEIYNFNLNDVTTSDRHAAKITGPTQLRATEVTINDLRDGATMLLAAMVAQGTSTIIDPANHIDRGYEAIEQSLSQLGASLTRSNKA